MPSHPTLRSHASILQHRAALGLMLASGFAGLGYQIVWTQQCSLWLGHEAAAVLAVVTAFFGGLALGALTLGRRIHRSHRPERWYAACEALIALWSVMLALLLSPVSDWLLAITGVQPTPVWQWAVAFVGTFVVLLPATAAMGATLPAMERVTARMGTSSAAAGLYASNTFGAVLGVLVTAFWLIPDLGLARTAAVCAALNIFCAASALTLASGDPASAKPASRSTRRGVLATLAVTGLLGIGYEVLVVRVLSQVAEDTVYTFAMLLAVYLVGSALGAAAYQRWLAASVRQGVLRNRLVLLQAVGCLLGTSSLWAAEDIRQAVQSVFGPSLPSALTAEAALALVAFGFPTVVMGALFSHLSQEARTSGSGFDQALGFNTIGAAAAPLLFGVLLVPMAGPKAALLMVVGGYLALLLPAAKTSLPAWGATASVGLLALWAPPLAFIDVPEGGHVISYRDGITASVSVVADASGVSRLRIDNRQQEGSSSTRWADARQALIPLLLHPAPARALFLGLGTGVTASSAAEDPTLQVDAVELLPEVIDASAHFTGAFAGSASRLHLMAADARRYVRATPQKYDVIVSDNFHPARSGSGSLYTVEHFRAVRRSLTGHGVFCQWLPLHQLDLDTLRSIVQAYIAVYPTAWAMLSTNSLETPVLGLVAKADDGRFDLSTLQTQLSGRQQRQHLADFGLPDEFALLGSFVAGPQSLARFAGSAALNTDDHPVVAYRAPRITYVPDSLPRDRLFALLRELHLAPAELIATASDATASSRLEAYWAARNSFLEAGKNVRPSGDPQQMLSQVREPLLAVLRTSPDFRPAYDPLLRLATAWGRSDPGGARALLVELKQLQPARPEADEALAHLAQ